MMRTIHHLSLFTFDEQQEKSIHKTKILCIKQNAPIIRKSMFDQ